MPLPRRKGAPRPEVGPADWRPQGYGRRGFRSIADPIIEPLWGGVRVIARIGPGGVTLTEEGAGDCTAEFAEQARAIGAAALATELTLDGYLTVEPTQKTAGVAIGKVSTPSGAQVMSQLIVGTRRPHAPEPGPELDLDRPVAFVAVDLLLVDGSTLLDVPLLERKRLLETALRTDELIRITPYVRQPIGSFLGTWRALGFRELAYKASNSRYRPGEQNDDWAIAQIPAR
jgi:ATP-dependent DNA ligase